MQSLTKYNKGIKYLLCAIDRLSKYAWVVPLKYKRTISIVNVHKKLISKAHKNQEKYGLIKAVNFTTIFSKDSWKMISLKSIQHTMKENLLLLKDLLGLWKTKFTSIWQLLQRMFILVFLMKQRYKNKI